MALLNFIFGCLVIITILEVLRNRKMITGFFAAVVKFLFQVITLPFRVAWNMIRARKEDECDAPDKMEPAQMEMAEEPTPKKAAKKSKKKASSSASAAEQTA